MLQIQIVRRIDMVLTKSVSHVFVSSGEAMSHFRFTDELEWDERDTAVPDATDAYSTVLSLNSADITESLACLPLHTVLGLSQNLFTVSHK